MAPAKKSVNAANNRSAPYDADTRSYTVASLKGELTKRGVSFPSTAKKATLLNLLPQSIRQTQDSETLPVPDIPFTNETGEIGDQRDLNAGSNNRVLIGLVSKLSSTVRALQKNVSTLTQKVNNLTNTPTESRNIQNEYPENGPSNTDTNVENSQMHETFNIEKALHAHKNPSTSSSGRTTNANIGTYKRTRFEYAAESLPMVETISPTIRNQIITGRDVLASLFIPYCNGPSSDGKDSSKDIRLNRLLKIGEFINAFGIYKNILGNVYPQRREELDKYERDIVDMATRYPGKGFYEYHKQFSLTAAAHLRYNDILVDWSIRNNTLFCNVFANSRPNTCQFCYSTLHLTAFCPTQNDGKSVRTVVPNVNNGANDTAEGRGNLQQLQRNTRLR
ncbi:uncharacterized protein LOC117118615 [Anneissia japonica]|uniref:uncharacterized protein LOC117118615 n=1 Tax=Anneissia japonica TaxID=1529436 RepID=UPI00142567BC|nr:uncharacterized protein LOC117118615 [Anneissia japonica]